MYYLPLFTISPFSVSFLYIGLYCLRWLAQVIPPLCRICRMSLRPSSLEVYRR
ncbi:hypothetical protein B9Z19DRAFT_1080627 [Tuber borchii]|uniref:Uncharacterized protein n=1 Tax=Tuber borchii TaxID=42251 RepID=A0A2T6ZWU8_TUBBO|nr:hypothetical protein B9Z19DRAFT_1080627 [Tuber borchii]